MIPAALHNELMRGLTISEERLRQFPEKGFEQAADHVQVLPPLLRHTREGLVFSMKHYTHTTPDVPQ